VKCILVTVKDVFGRSASSALPHSFKLNCAQNVLYSPITLSVVQCCSISLTSLS